MDHHIDITTTSRSVWINMICKHRRIPVGTNNDCIHVKIFDNVKKESVEAFHIVTQSCLIENLKSKNYKIIFRGPGELMNFFFSDVNIKRYWSNEPVYHVDSPNIHRLNLWRITDKGKESYSISVTNYFQKLFQGKDISFITTALNELYYNVFDHSKADGNAFSYIYYDSLKARMELN